MRLECWKILTPKQVGFAVFIFLIIYAAVLGLPEKVGIHNHILLNRIQGLISEKTTQQMVSDRYVTTSTTKINQLEKITMKITKATAKMVPKNKPKKALIKIFATSPSEKSATRNVTLAFQTTTMVVGRVKWILTTKINHQKEITTKSIKEKTPTMTTTATTTTTKIPNTTIMKILTITPPRNPSKSQGIPKTSKVHSKTTALPKHFICLNSMGRLGNLMFEYASAYGIARSKGMDVIISEKERIVKIFHLNRGGRVVKDTSMCKGVRTISEARASAFDKKTINFSNDKNVALWGYLQSYKYFDEVSDEIRRQFTFRDSFKIKAEKVIRGILEEHLKKHKNESQDWTFVAVHVRRGDMVNHPHGYMVAPKEYFHRTQNMFRALKQHVIFVVCSDDIKWCKANMKSNDTYFVEGNSPEVDMAILSSCNHTISSVGSFSWWSAWLAKGLVTYFCPPARPGSGLRRAYSKDFSDYFPSKWIRVELKKIPKVSDE